MRKFFLVLFTLMATKSFAQKPVSISIPYAQSPQQTYRFDEMPSPPINIKRIAGDYWSQSKGSSGSASFARYYFLTDGAVVFESGYSGGIYFAAKYQGKYKLDEKNSTVTLRMKKVSSNGHIKPPSIPHNIHACIKIVGLNDTIVAIQSGKDTLVYNRARSYIKGQTLKSQLWRYDKRDTKAYENGRCDIDENDWFHYIEFQHTGQLTYSASNSWKGNKEYSFQGSYQLRNDTIYFDISSKRTLGYNLAAVDAIQRFEPNKQAYIRVNIKKKKINLSDLMRILNNGVSSENESYSDDEWVVLTERQYLK